MKIIAKSIAVMAFAAVTSLPAAGQINLRFGIPLPEVEVRVGHRAPPKLLNERKTHRPGRDFVWLRGSWAWQRDDWAWEPGRWERPNDHGQRWVKAKYRQEGRAWRYEPAHWSNQRLVEGEDYRRWRSENQQDQNHNRDRDHDRDHHDR